MPLPSCGLASPGVSKARESITKYDGRKFAYDICVTLHGHLVPLDRLLAEWPRRRAIDNYRRTLVYLSAEYTVVRIPLSLYYAIALPTTTRLRCTCINLRRSKVPKLMRVR